MNIHVIGAGRLGSALINALYSQPIFKLSSVISTSCKSDISCPVYSSITRAPAFDGIVFICVPDDKIREIAVQLLETKKLTEGTIVSHVSGARSSAELSKLSEAGFSVASFHPMQTFTDRNVDKAFEGVHISIESPNQNTYDILMELAKQLRATGKIFDAETKTTLHIAGVIISNFMSALFLTAGDVLSTEHPEQDADFARKYFARIATQTLDNIISNGFPAAITGPASRGDLQTIQKHLDLLKDENIASMYSILSARLAQETLSTTHPLRVFFKNHHS